MSPAGCDVSEVLAALTGSESRISLMNLFPARSAPPLPVGEITVPLPPGEVPRTHALALRAAQQALKDTAHPPDAIVVGTTTGGMLTTEQLLQEQDRDPDRYVWHAPGTVGEYVARSVGCRGPVLTLSTACASGTTVMKVALQLIRSGSAARVLAIGADSLCRLTYYGFSLLQLVDPTGAKPFDRDRCGLSVAEAAAAMLLEGGTQAPAGAMAEIRGGGLSCDAYHVTAPHKDGEGAVTAMKTSLHDAGIEAHQVDYVNLHGTGTPENDAAEAKAIHAVFGSVLPDMSSTKGIYGHPLAAAGMVEALIGVLCIAYGIVPANVGCCAPDGHLGLQPVLEPKKRKIGVVLSNSFGFGGNNAAVVLTRPDLPQSVARSISQKGFRVSGSACITGAGHRDETLAILAQAQTCRGTVPEAVLTRHLDSRLTRRLERLAILALSLANSAYRDSRLSVPPGSIYFGTGLGALTETHGFLARLFETGEKFSSPTDFVGSLHNSPASQVALMFGCKGANITATGTDDAFEEALYCASLVAEEGEGPLLCLAADEAHILTSPLLDRSTSGDRELSDGGGAFVLEPTSNPSKAHLFPAFLEYGEEVEKVIDSMISTLGGTGSINKRFGALFVNIPWAFRKEAIEQLCRFVSLTGFSGPTVDYRRVLGQYATVSAVACVIAEHLARTGRLAPAFTKGEEVSLDGKGILMLGLGPKVSAISVRG